jgi:fructokinase
MRFKCVGLGEALWDLLPAGRQLGGAPANFAYHAAALGAESRIVSRVGTDELGRDLLARLAQLGLSAAAIGTDPAAPTGTVTVTLGTDGQPRYVIHEPVAWDFIADDSAALAAVSAADVVCFGTLAQRHPVSRAALRRLLAHTRPAALRVFDINLRQHFHSPAIIAESLALASVLKVNDAELPHLATQFGLPSDERAALAALVSRFGLRAAVLTRGERGSLLWADGAWAEIAAPRVTVVDTVGAGDAFTAAFALGLLAGWPLDVIGRRAAEIAAYVCTQAGATPLLLPALRAPFAAAQSTC